jgi:hypothetical protein
MPVQTSKLPYHEQWRVLLLLRRTASGGTLALNTVDRATAGGVGFGLLPLFELGWLHSRRHGQPIDYPNHPGNEMDGVEIGITTRGRQWLNRNRENRAMFAIYTAGARVRTRGVLLTNVYETSGAGTSHIARLAVRRYIDLLDQPGGEPVTPDDLSSRVVAVRLTYRGQELVET